MLKYGADVNAIDSTGMTSLMHAYQCNIHNNADSLIRDLDKHSVSAWDSDDSEEEYFNGNCSREKVTKELIITRDEIISILLNHNVDVDKKTVKYGSILHYISEMNANYLPTETENVAEVLLNKGADVNAVNHMGRTPLHTAIQNR